MELHITIYNGLKVLYILENIKWTKQFLKRNACCNIYRPKRSVTFREHQVNVRVLKWKSMKYYIF